MPKARGLGKGLGALMAEQAARGEGAWDGTREIPLDLIDPSPFQPRRRFAEDSLQELAQSIAVHGVVQPVVVRERAGRYQLVLGERRVRASRLAGKTAVPALVRHWTDAEALEVALVENLQRDDLTPIEEAEGLRRLLDEFGWTQEQMAERIGKSRPHVTNLLRLLQLDPEAQSLVADGRLTVAHAKVLLGVPGERRAALARKAAADGWTVRQLAMMAARPDASTPRPLRDPHLHAVETRLRRRFGARVVLRGTAERGKVEIPYRSLEELERVLSLLDEDTAGPPDNFAV